ncbi:hypothetical protein [Kutzneria albida]|uniref:Uncharacterized protein n=1 Tax=Kutzneria albida DSM 43870 TaxID=1449976 RepID=W5W153_9PSEU|nr:hypothetical protein [Kutzneria albida]AHH94525.1 hypothetical protein KALB_1152 [Kutzneria albida DSM 43870]
MTVIDLDSTGLFLVFSQVLHEIHTSHGVTSHQKMRHTNGQFDTDQLAMLMDSADGPPCRQRPAGVIDFRVPP